MLKKIYFAKSLGEGGHVPPGSPGVDPPCPKSTPEVHERGQAHNSYVFIVKSEQRKHVLAEDFCFNVTGIVISLSITYRCHFSTFNGTAPPQFLFLLFYYAFIICHKTLLALAK